jgi:DNA-binding NtrC family response regulator
VGKENLLIIDDSRAIAGSLSQLLELVLSDASVVAEVDFAAGMQRIEKEAFTTIILDVSCMVKHSRNQKEASPTLFLKDIQMKQPTARIILMSGRPLEEVKELIEIGIEHPFLMKPFSLSTLLETMNSASESRDKLKSPELRLQPLPDEPFLE